MFQSKEGKQTITFPAFLKSRWKKVTASKTIVVGMGCITAGSLIYAIANS